MGSLVTMQEIRVEKALGELKMLKREMERVFQIVDQLTEQRNEARKEADYWRARAEGDEK